MTIIDGIVRTQRSRNTPPAGKVLEVVGTENDPRAASLIAIHTHGIPMGFSEAAEAEAADAEPALLELLRPPAPQPQVVPQPAPPGA